MLFNKTIKLLICLVMIFPYLLYGSGQVSAASSYNHAELMEYEGYGKAMYEGLVEETSFITGQYTDNKEYVSNSIDEIKDYAKFWWEENKVEGEGVGEKLKDVFVKGAAYTLTVGDWVKKFFSDYDTAKPDPDPDAEVDYSPYSVALEHRSIHSDLIVKDGFVVYLYHGNDSRGASAGYPIYADMLSDITTGYYQYRAYVGVDFVYGPPRVMYQDMGEYLAANEYISIQKQTLSGHIAFLKSLGYRIEVTRGGQILDLEPMIPSKPARADVIKYVNDAMADQPVRIPEPTPSLTCPNGEKINLTVDGSTFLNSDGSVMLVNKDGTATVNGTSCALQWKTPEMGYVDDKAAMTDPQGNWLDVITGEVLECVVVGECKPSVPGEDEEIEELDKGLIEYVKNAYEYATGVLKTATDGLKSLATGAKDLTSLFGTFFSWLPSEMVVLMSSGLGIAIGLRLFRK